MLRNNGDPVLPVDLLCVEPRLASVLIVGNYSIGRGDYRSGNLNIFFVGNSAFNVVWRLRLSSSSVLTRSRAMNANSLKDFMKIFGNETIGHIIWIETILIDVQLSLSAHYLT